MDKKVEGILLQIVKKLGDENGWMIDKDWELTFKSDGHISLVRSLEVEGSLDGDTWTDQISTAVHLTMSSEDEWTFWPTFTIYAQIQIGSIPPEDIAYKMSSNVPFMAEEVKDASKAGKAAREINRVVETHIGKSYQDYVSKNKEVVRFYKHSSSDQT